MDKNTGAGGVSMLMALAARPHSLERRRRAFAHDAIAASMRKGLPLSADDVGGRPADEAGQTKKNLDSGLSV